MTPKELSDIHEEEFAIEVNGNRVPGSGNTREKPGDVINQKFFFQLKRTDMKSISVKRKDVGKNEMQAISNGKIPAFVLGFSHRPYLTQNWVAFPMWWLKQQDWFIPEE